MTAAKVHRDLKLSDDLMEGPDVEALQNHLNDIAKQLDRLLNFKLTVDGKFGEKTLHATIKASFVMGVSERRLDEMTRKRLVAQPVQLDIRQPDERDADERERAERRREELRENLDANVGRDDVKVSTSPGHPHWGGSGDVMTQFIEPFMVKRGLPIGSGKRTPAENAAVGGSATSDHLTTKTTTAARDFPTFTGEDDARALADKLGNSSWQPNSFATFNFSAGGHTFRAQILWGAAIGHGDHVHVGVSPA